MPGKSWPMVGRAWGRTNSGTTRKLKGSRVSGIARNASRSSTEDNANPRSQLLPSGSLGHTGVGRQLGFATTLCRLSNAVVDGDLTTGAPNRPTFLGFPVVPVPAL